MNKQLIVLIAVLFITTACAKQQAPSPAHLPPIREIPPAQVPPPQAIQPVPVQAVRTPSKIEEPPKAQEKPKETSHLPGLIAWWSLEDVKQTDSINNIPLVTSIPVTQIEGKFAKTLISEGNTFSFKTESSPLLNPASFSIAVWGRLTGDKGKGMFNITNKGALMSGYQLQASAGPTGKSEDSELLFNVGRRDLNQQTYVKNRVGKIQNGSWHFYTATYDEKTQLMKDYLDGVPIATGGQGHLEPGQGLEVTGINAQIDELQIYDRELSPSEVKTLLTKGPSGSAT